MSKYSWLFLLSKVETGDWEGKGILVSSKSTELQIEYYLMHWKADSKNYIRASLASIIEKISVEIDAKIEQSWKLTKNKQTCNKV